MREWASRQDNADKLIEAAAIAEEVVAIRCMAMFQAGPLTRRSLYAKDLPFVERSKRVRTIAKARRCAHDRAVEENIRSKIAKALRPMSMVWPIRCRGAAHPSSREGGEARAAE